jgi:hypothetical protein
MEPERINFQVVPAGQLEQMRRDIDRILQILEKKDDSPGRSLDSEWITEQEAMDLLKRSKTWFHYKRKDGTLPGSKAGNRWYYKRTELEQFISKPQP